MEISLKGKKVLVTGASRGVGRAVTELVVKAGASKVYAVDILKDELDKLAAEVNNVHPIHLDISDWSATESQLTSIEPVDCLVNNAGICWNTSPGKIKESDFDELFAVNTKAVINITQIISNSMVKAGIKGSIVNVSSLGSVKVYPPFLVYSVSKAANDHITRNFAAQLGPQGIRVNGVNPHAILTQMLATSIRDPEEAERLSQLNTITRYLQPEEVGKVILFLLSDWAETINGTTLPIDCGHLLS
ncbi:L-xylulose reductase-like [Panonychus citri]|uniref:L-xylulose reductase-like n=1 Tax=Panonychus citri TaxID=50023 RepID=UPI0023083305|nr:L-xylulose reductase-like [Panonychus citri]